MLRLLRRSAPRSTRRLVPRLFLFSALTVILFLLIGCGAAGRLEYEPPVIPLLVSIDTNGEIALTLTNPALELPTPLGTFRAAVEARFPTVIDDLESTLTIRFDNQDHIYDLHGRNFDIEFEPGYYEKVAVTKVGSHILLELRRAAALPAAAKLPDLATPTSLTEAQVAGNPPANRPPATPEPSATPTPIPTTSSRPVATLRTTPTPSATPTQIPTDTPTPTATPVPPVCNISVEDRFRNLWERGGGISAGCPQGQAYTRRVAYQPFQNGFMYWVASPSGDAGGMIYVLYANGLWQEYPDTWVEGMTERAGHSPPAGLVEPRRGFGNLWRQLGGPSASIGWALQDETGSDFGLLQAFPNNAVILQFPEQSPIFMPDGKKWVK